jgi:hypothetical protein
MGKYRKLPVVIEAVQLRWDTWDEVCKLADVGPNEGQPKGCYVDATENEETNDTNGRIGLKIPTLEGVMLAVENDWVIRGVKGELYPCKPDIFAATYESVESEGRDG